MDSYENEVELAESLNVLWKRRWLIIVPTILVVLVAGIVSLLLPPKWDVEAIIQPSRVFVRSEQGMFTEVTVMDPKELAGQINRGSYNNLISAELNLDPRRFPLLIAENMRDTKLVRMRIRTGETDEARKILDALFKHLKGELDQNIDVEVVSHTTRVALKENDIKARELDIQSLNIDIEKSRQEIISAGNKMKISEGYSRNLLEEMKAVKARIDDLEKQQKTMLAEKKEGVEILELFLSSSEIQQNLREYHSLDENLSTERNKQEDLRLSVRKNEQIIKGLRTQIDKMNQVITGLRTEIELLNKTKRRVDYAQLIKEPAVSLNPVSPRKKVIIAGAGFLAFFCFSILAVFLDYVKKGNSRLKTGRN